MEMKIDKNLFLDGDISLAKRYFKEKGSEEIKILISIIGLELFSQIILNKKLQGRHIIIPRKTTLLRMVMLNKIKDELGQFRKKSEGFKNHVKKLANHYSKHPHQIMKIYNEAK